jgi:hypothetical protein
MPSSVIPTRVPTPSSRTSCLVRECSPHSLGAPKWGHNVSLALSSSQDCTVSALTRSSTSGSADSAEQRQLGRFALHCTALHCTALHCTALHCTALHCTALHGKQSCGCAAARCSEAHTAHAPAATVPQLYCGRVLTVYCALTAARLQALRQTAPSSLLHRTRVLAKDYALHSVYVLQY